MTSSDLGAGAEVAGDVGAVCAHENETAIIAQVCAKISRRNAEGNPWVEFIVTVFLLRGINAGGRNRTRVLVSPPRQESNQKNDANLLPIKPGEAGHNSRFSLPRQGAGLDFAAEFSEVRLERHHAFIASGARS